MRKSFLFTAAALLLIGGNALAQDVRYNFDKDADFSKFKSYKWVDIKDAQKPNDIVDKQIKETVDAQLATKGLTKVDGDADLLIGYQVAIGTEKQFTSYNSDWGYGAGWYRGGWYGGGGMSTTTGQTSTIYVGQLGLDMVEMIQLFRKRHPELLAHIAPADGSFIGHANRRLLSVCNKEKIESVLSYMRERLRIIGGELSIWSRPSYGTHIEASVPVVLKQRQEVLVETLSEMPDLPRQF